jgi:hypothetical protein
MSIIYYTDLSVLSVVILTECPISFSFSSISPTYGDSVWPPWLDQPDMMVVIFMPANSCHDASLADWNDCHHGNLTVMLPFPKIIRPASMSNCVIAEFFAPLAPTKAHDPRVVVMPSSSPVMKLSCKPNKSLPKSYRMFVCNCTDLEDNWNSMEWAASFAVLTFFVQRCGGTQYLVSRRSGNENVEKWLMAINLLKVLPHNFHAVDFAFCQEAL